MLFLAYGTAEPTWIEQAQDEMTCTIVATDAERAELGAALIPRRAASAVVASYFRNPPKDAHQAKLRYLTSLAALAWSADRTNDQALRTQLYLTIGISAQSDPDAQGRLLRQISLCARTWLISSAIESGDPADAVRLADDLAARYRASPAEASVEDWPVILAMRELSHGPDTAAGIDHLIAVVAERAKALEPVDGDRASRLYSAAARGLLVLGKPDQANGAGALSIKIAGPDAKREAAWRVYPALYDGLEKLSGRSEAASLTKAFLELYPLPSTFIDTENEFAVRLRLAFRATGEGHHDEATRQSIAARAAALDEKPVRHSIPFLRQALVEFDRQDDDIPDPVSGKTGTQSFDIVVAKSPAIAKRWYTGTYRGLYDEVLAQAQNMFVSDAREQIVAADKIDGLLANYARLYQALPEFRGEIQDRSFRLTQLRSYGRLTLATVSAALQTAAIDPKQRFDVERFFTMSTQNSVWLRNIWNRHLAVAPGSLPKNEDIWHAFFAMDVFFNETTQAFGQYVAFVRREAPALDLLITPRPMALREFQQLLRPGEALIATLVAKDGLYVWGLTRNTSAMKRQPIRPAEVRHLVHDLRQSLVGQGSGGQIKVPPFDAAAAYELYRLTFGSMPEVLKGATHVLWYGHDSLASVPPAILVTEKPSLARMTTARQFTQTRFVADLFPVSVLADLSLLRLHRQARPQGIQSKAFLGLGAPMLSKDEEREAGGGHVFDFSGGDNGKSLADLSTLPDAADELRSLAATLGESRSTIWLGAEASFQHLRDAQPSDYQIIAFATHGFTSTEVQGVDEPTLLLAPPPGAKDPREGLLTSRQIAAMKLDADLVILSACNSATSDGRPSAEAFTGLSQAFFTAGARALMVSHWPVATGAAADLSVGLAQGLKQDRLPLALSLQRAIAKVRQQGQDDDLQAHPFYWGPFVIVGDGAVGVSLLDNK